LSEVRPLTGEPDAGDPPVRFGGRGAATQCGFPTPIKPATPPRRAQPCDREEFFPAALPDSGRLGRITSGGSPDADAQRETVWPVTAGPRTPGGRSGCRP